MNAVKIAIAATAAVALILLAACGGSEKKTAESAAKTTACCGDDDAGGDTLVINTAEELAGFAKMVNLYRKSFEGRTVMLGRDIAINDTANWRDWANNPPAREWAAIGTDNWAFHGTFDGNGRAISGVYIKNTKNDQGLFGVIGYHGTVKRLSVIASRVEGANYVGLLAGYNIGTITECHASGAVAGDSAVGGLVGVNNGTVKSSHAAGSVKGKVSVGGFMGSNGEGGAAGNHSSASVFGNSIAGGFAGENISGMMSGNFSTGRVTGRASSGGFAGRTYGGTMQNNYYDNETSGQKDSGKGEGKTTAQMQSKETVDSLNSIAGFSSANAWVHSENKYPVLSGKIAASADINGYFAGGNGTEAAPYVIRTKRQLESFARLVNLGVRFSGKHVKLGQSIVLNNTAKWQKWETEPPAYVWTPAGAPANPFDGTFDGGGHTVSGVYVNNPKGCFIGLFGIMSGDATIRNTGVTASYIRGRGAVGGLVGGNGNMYNKGGRIIDSYSAATVAGEGSNTGGLAGRNDGGTISGCRATGKVKGGSVAGGLVGIANGGAISSSYATGAVFGDSDGRGRIGGLVGSNNAGTIDRCYAIGAVSSGGEYIGGLVGFSDADLEGGTISNSYSAGSVSGNDYVGGLAGGGQKIRINRCYTVSTVTAADESGPLVGLMIQTYAHRSYFKIRASDEQDTDRITGSGKTAELMKRKETFADWDFDTIWGINRAVNNGYPHLLGMPVISVAEKPEGNDKPVPVSKYAGNPGASVFTVSTAEELAALAKIVNGTLDGSAVKLTGDADFLSPPPYDNDEQAASEAPGGQPSKDNFKGKLVRLTNNIDLSGYDNWVPIGPFGGTFDGGGHVISNLTINRPGSDYLGLFSRIGNVKNLGLENVNIQGGNYIGGIAGTVSGSVANCYAAGSVRGRHRVGGITGWLIGGGVIANCYSAGEVKSKDAGSGGLAGAIDWYKSSKITYSYSTAAVEGFDGVGGLVGGTSKAANIFSCAALNPRVNKVRKNFAGRVAGGREGRFQNNVAYTEMAASGGNTEWDRKDAAEKDGKDITLAEIKADGAIGGRFTEENGWTTENGKLPGLFGKAAAMPEHLRRSP